MSDENVPHKFIDLSKIESRTTVSSLLAPFVLGLNCIGILCCGYVLYSLSTTLHELSGVALIEVIKEDFTAFQKVDVSIRASAEKVRGLEATLDAELNQRSIVDATESVQQTEKNAQLFLRLLKVNMYNLSSYIPGIASWYELNSPALDLAIERSRSRQLKLLEIRAFYEQTP
jgi:hypothetical protein